MSYGAFAKQAARYREAEVLSASPAQLVVIVYEHLLTNLRRARLQLAPSEVGRVQHNAVDGHGVPVRHFGIVLPMAEWQALAARLRRQGVAFLIEPHTRFVGQPGEQATMFFLDPSGNALEFKAFADSSRLFAK